MKNSKIRYIFLFFLILLLSLNIISSFFSLSNNCREISHLNDFETSIMSDYIEISTFPVDLDLLFWGDNLSVRNQKLDAIGNASWGWMMTPWGGFFTSGHVEGAPKWYLYADRWIEVFAPHDGTLDGYHIGNGTVIQVNGTDVIYDVGLTIHIGNQNHIQLGHLNILKTIHDEIQSTDTYTFTEGELIGYTDPISALDFHYYYRYCDICPYPYLSSDLQTKLTSLYNLQYERAKIGGVYPESKMCRNMSIEIENTIWGPWWYETGPYDSYLEGSESRYDVFEYEFGGITFLNRNLTNAETFHKDPKNPSQNLSDSIIGLFRDNSGATNIPAYNMTGPSLVELVAGNFTQGILKIITNWQSDWGPGNTTIYARILVDIQDVGFEDDLLLIDFFSNLLDAQAGFTNANMTFTRYLQCEITSEDGNNIPIRFSFIIVGIIASFALWVILNKRGLLLNSNV